MMVTFSRAALILFAGGGHSYFLPNVYICLRQYMASCCYRTFILTMLILYRNGLSLEMFCCAFSISQAGAEYRAESKIKL